MWASLIWISMKHFYSAHLLGARNAILSAAHDHREPTQPRGFLLLSQPTEKLTTNDAAQW